MLDQPTIADVVAEMRHVGEEAATEAQLRRWARALYYQGPWFFHWHWPKDSRVVERIADEAENQAAAQAAEWKSLRERAHATAMLADIARNTARDAAKEAR